MIILPSSAMNFLAGILAGAAINLLTSVATGPTDTSTLAIVIDAVAWLLAAIAAAWYAHLSETYSREVDRRLTPELSLVEANGVRRTVRTEKARRLWLAATSTVLASILAVLLLPHILLR
jgi:hypothetical protein